MAADLSCRALLGFVVLGAGDGYPYVASISLVHLTCLGTPVNHQLVLATLGGRPLVRLVII